MIFNKIIYFAYVLIKVTEYLLQNNFIISPLQADPYVEVTLGKKTISLRDTYRPNTLNPVFGESVLTPPSPLSSPPSCYQLFIYC